MDLSDIKLVKSTAITDTDANGGRAGHTEIVNGARQNVFPIVTAANRAAGVTRYRKLFFRQDAAGTPAPIAYETALYLLHQTNGGDRKHFGAGTTRDTQVQMLADEPVWCSAGKLDTALSGGETEIDIEFESNDAEFTPGGELYISSRFLVSQTIADGVNPGDSVTYNESAAEWRFASFTTDVD